MINCIICHNAVQCATLSDIDFESRRGKRLRDIDFVSICHECVKRQNKKRFKIFS